ncbi:unnamed protein product, partial [Brachionus calyciflorus]
NRFTPSNSNNTNPAQPSSSKQPLNPAQQSSSTQPTNSSSSSSSSTQFTNLTPPSSSTQSSLRTQPSNLSQSSNPVQSNISFQNANPSRSPIAFEYLHPLQPSFSSQFLKPVPSSSSTQPENNRQEEIINIQNVDRRATNMKIFKVILNRKFRNHNVLGEYWNETLKTTSISFTEMEELRPVEFAILKGEMNPYTPIGKTFDQAWALAMQSNRQKRSIGNRPTNL